MLTNEELAVKYKETKEEKWLKKILENNKALVESIINKKDIDRKDYSLIEDLKQEADIAIWKSIKNYDSKKNAKFTTYAYKRIDGAINTFLRKNGKIPIPYKALKKYKEHNEYTRNYEKENGREPTKKEIMENIELNENDFDIIYDIEGANRIISLEQENEQNQIGNKVIDPNDFVNKILISETFKELVKIIDAKIDSRNKSILWDCKVYEKKLVELERKYNLTQQGIGYVRDSTIKKLLKDKNIQRIKKEYNEIA